MEAILTLLPGLAIYAAIMGIIPTYLVENCKAVMEAKKTGDWSPVYKRGSALLMAIGVVWFSPTLVPMTSIVVSKIVTAFVVAALSSDGLYPALKRLRGTEPQPVTLVNPFPWEPSTGLEVPKQNEEEH